MHFHLPKPLHGWREFAGEVGVIVLGVVIALTAEQWLQDREWARLVEQARAAMRTELADDNGPQAQFRSAINPCVQTSLEEIREAVEAKADRTTITQAIERYKVPFFTWDSLAYQAAVGSGATAHMGSQETAQWIGAYSLMNALDTTNRKEFSDQAELRALNRAGGPLSAEEDRQLLRAVELLRSDNATMMSAIDVLLHGMNTLEVQSADALRNRVIRRARSDYPQCRPKL